ncbi:MAG: LamG-like jellyroll fold domain-containing protein [Verrucomicrobiota bacterium]
MIYPSMFGQWIHLASPFDAETGVIHHYLNGESFDPYEPKRIKNTKIILARGEIGNWGLKRDRPAVRNFDGAIDEVIIFNRALSGEEIQEIYQIGSKTGSPRMKPPIITQIN